MWEIEVDHSTYPIEGEQDLTQSLDRIDKSTFGELWLKRKHKGDALVIQTNSALAVLTYFGQDGHFLYSQSVAYCGDKEDETEFYCGCGTLTPLPTFLAIPKEDGLRAILHFFRTERLPEWISWHEP
jgi:hypothetical protein